MKGLISLVIVLAIAFGIYYLAVRQVTTTSDGGGSNPTQAITTTGIKNDLNAIAQAERLYFSQHGTYASLDTLIESGALTASRREREGYIYSVEVSGAGFTVTARHPAAGHPAFAIDQTMQIRTLP